MNRRDFMKEIALGMASVALPINVSASGYDKKLKSVDGVVSMYPSNVIVDKPIKTFELLPTPGYIRFRNGDKNISVGGLFGLMSPDLLKNVQSEEEIVYAYSKGNYQRVYVPGPVEVLMRYENFKEMLDESWAGKKDFIFTYDLDEGIVVNGKSVMLKDFYYENVVGKERVIARLKGIPIELMGFWKNDVYSKPLDITPEDIRGMSYWYPVCGDGEVKYACKAKSKNALKMNVLDSGKLEMLLEEGGGILRNEDDFILEKVYSAY